MRNISVMGDEGSDYASHAEVRCENCRVPQTNLLGREGHGFAIAQEEQAGTNTSLHALDQDL